jgi:hypothetical protein
MMEQNVVQGGEKDGGIFGRWIEDDAGLPAFAYELDQRVDPRAEWDTRLIGKSRMHWHQIGNDRLIAIATDAGWVQLYSHEDGPRWINHYRSDDHVYAGGVSYLADADRQWRTWSTFYDDLPAVASVTRTFGCGYVRFLVEYEDVELDRIVFAPFGDGRLLASLVRVTNVGARARHLRHGEYWDAWLTNIDFPVGSGERFVPEHRDQVSKFLYAGYGAGWTNAIGGLRARHPDGPPGYRLPHIPGPTARTQPDLVCVPLGTPVDGWSVARSDLWGKGTRKQPDGLLSPTCRNLPAEGDGQDVAFFCATELELDPGESATLGFVYGAAPPDEVAGEVRVLGADPAALFEATRLAWHRTLPSVDFAGEGWLARELKWGAYYVRSGATYHRGFRAHTFSQGGAYQYIGGFNAGPRATVQHALPLVWLAPELAAEAARFTMAETAPNGEIAYAEVGAGLWEQVRYCPSDNDLWLLWLVAEYVLATRDKAFLRQPVSYWPAPYTRPEPVWDHCGRAIDHLLESVGVGPHGLIKLRLGDWNDLIVRESEAGRERVWEEAESTLNTAMAVWVLRRVAELADYGEDSRRAARCRQLADRFAEAVRTCWRGTHLNRGWSDASTEIGAVDVFLEPQPWALIAGILDDEQAKTLVGTIRESCADRLGTRIFGDRGGGSFPTLGGGQWPAINSTLVWGFGRVDPREAWRELRDNTLHHHAVCFPEIWYGIWSGPDTYLPTSLGEYGGQTWSWPGFGMQSWPVQILFVHSEPLNASLWLAGVLPGARGLQVDPLLPFEEWSWDGGLLSLRYSADEVTGELGALANERIEVDVTLPTGLRSAPVVVTVLGRAVTSSRMGSRVLFQLPVGPGNRTPFAIRAASVSG